MSARLRLRECTRNAHEAVDHAYAAFDLSTSAGYRAFLSAQARAFLPVEAAADHAGADGLIPDWPARRRGDLLKRDLGDLGLPVGFELEPVELSGAPAVLGAVYVLEGSRLGGKLLRRRIPSGAPSRFLGARDPAAPWRDLIGILDHHLTDPDDLGAAVASARATFDVFLSAANTKPCS